MKLYIGILILILNAPAGARTQAQAEPTSMNFCDVVTSAVRYDGQTLSVEAILLPSEHSLSIYGSACVPHEGYNVTTQAILPSAWESQPSGKRLREILKHRRSARVVVVGIFESSGGPYGPDAARFRFSITKINVVSEQITKSIPRGGSS